jgi:Domain of unknown function (DUF4175)
MRGGESSPTLWRSATIESAVNSTSSTKPSVLRHARRLALRLWSIHALRGLCFACGAATSALIIASFTAEPVLTRVSAAWVWAMASAAFALALMLALAPLRNYRGAKIADVLSVADPSLAHRMRSALELSAAGADPQTSNELQAAHIAGVQRALDALPTRRVLPWTGLIHSSLLFGLLALLAFAALSLQRPPLLAFVRALIAPAQERSDGTRIAQVVQSTQVQLSYPSYLGRNPTWLENPSEISVPAGTTLELRVKPRFAAERGKLHASSQTIALAVADDGTLRGQLTARSKTQLRFELESHGIRYEDPRAIALDVTADNAPVVEIIEPHTGTLAPPGEAIALRFVATDDLGLANVNLHARVADGPEKQRQVFSAIDDGGPQRELHSGLQLVPEELGAREGDTLVIWLEARDTDLVSGPHVGRSQEITLEVAQPGQGLSELIPSLQEIADAAVDLLGVRLDHAVPKESAEARARFEALSRATHAWLEQIDTLLRNADQTHVASLEVDRMRGMRKRNERLLTSEAVLHEPTTRGFTERTDVDTRHVDELERDVLFLADTLARAHVDEAKAIAEELRELKRHIETLLDQLGKTHSPEAERELMREIAQAQRRLGELAQSLSRMATRVPGEFVNRDAMQKDAAESSLANLQRAVQDHDLRSAAEHLDALAKQIDDLAAQLGQGGLRLQESRFGPRDQAMAEARQKLGMLGSEQNRLAERSAAVTRSALDRTQGNQGEARARGLLPQAEALEQAASELAQGQTNGFQSGAANRAAERLRDARDALRSGDLAKAQEMTGSAMRGLRENAAELESEARMFPGRHGEAAQRAEAARKAVSDAERLSSAIDHAMPPLEDHINDAEREKLRADADAQQKTADAAGQLKKAFDKGPDGMPLSPEATDALSEAQESMQRAQHALEHGRPDQANREQQQAAERLQKLSQSLAEQQRSGNRGGSGHKQGSTGENGRDAPVHIPGAEEWKGPTELRRKLLDAMHESGPAGYEAATQQYYQELMR